MAQQLLVGQGLLIIEASQSHSYTWHLVVFLWTGDQPVAVTSIWQHTTLPRDRISRPRPQSHAFDRAATISYIYMYNLHKYFYYIQFCFPVAQQPLGRLIGEVSRSHTIRHTHPVVLLWTSDLLVSEAATYTTHNKHKRRIPMLAAGFESPNLSSRAVDTYTLNRTTTTIGCCIQRFRHNSKTHTVAMFVTVNT